MSTDTLRYAAAAIREQNVVGRGFIDDTLLAVADWLDSVARTDARRSQPETHEFCDNDCDVTRALIVARTYLGRAA